MKNASSRVVSFKSEKKDKLKQPIQKFDSLSSFKMLKQGKTNAHGISTTSLVFVRRNSLFHSNVQNQGGFISTRPKNKQKNIESITTNRKSTELKILKPMKLLIKYARNKIKKEYISPYINRLIKPTNNIYKPKKDEDKPIYYNLYKINDIFYNKRSKFNLNFLETNILLCENEYLIKSFKKKEVRIILRYLLGYIFFKDINSRSQNDRYNHRVKIVYREFFEYVNNNYTLNDPDSESNRIMPNQRNRRESVLLTNNLFILSLKAKRDKIIYPFLKSSNYFLIKDMPIKMIPNAIPNYFSSNKIQIIMTKWAFYKKYNVNLDLLKNINKNNIYDKSANEMNSSFIANSNVSNIIDNLTDESDSNEESFGNNNLNNGILKTNKIKHENNKNEIENIKKLLKNFEEKKEVKKVHFETNENRTKQKKHIIIRKKKIIRQPYEDYEIVQNENFYINKSDKSNIFKYLNNKMLNLSNVKLRNKNKLKTIIYTKKSGNIENIKTSSNEKFKRKDRFFLTHTNPNYLINEEKTFYNKNRNNLFKTYKRNILQNEFNLSNSNNIYNNKNAKFKVYNDLVRQKKIRFSIIPPIKIIKFKNTSQFISKINNSVKEKIDSKTLIKEIIINYQKNLNERKTNSIYFPEISKLRINTINNVKRVKVKKKNKSMNYRNVFISPKKCEDKLHIEDILKHKKIKI
jgi:hypothetical protein